VKRGDPQIWFDKRDCDFDAQGQCTVNPSKGFTIPIDRFTWRTKVVFIAACQLAETFLGLWNISETTPRALIVPVSGPTVPTDLDMAALAWRKIASKLSTGSSVYEAVNDANTLLAQSVYIVVDPETRQPVLDPVTHQPRTATVTLRFHAIGGNGGRDVKLR